MGKQLCETIGLWFGMCMSNLFDLQELHDNISIPTQGTGHSTARLSESWKTNCFKYSIRASTSSSNQVMTHKP